MLISLYGLTLDTEELGHVFHMTRKSVRQQIYVRRFPVRTYKLGDAKSSAVVADAADVAEYLDECRANRAVCPAGTAA